MAKATVLRFRRGTAADHAAFTGAVSEVTHNTTTGRLHVHGGVVQGGIPLARLDEISGETGDFVTEQQLSTALEGYATEQALMDGLETKAGTAAATKSANGLMSKEDKTKLDDIDPSELMKLGTTIDYGMLTDT